ncbi:MAG: NAD(P)-binding domain-containing protein [Acidobacteria bacterium]|nr:NAD(P)-binding domain-containing protein [Acidobacteriota bacterium]
MKVYDALVVGAGPAGLATSRELTRAGVTHLVLERGDQIGHTWANLYTGLVLHTGKHLSALPGLPFPPSTPLFPTRSDFVSYLHRYAGTFRLPVETHAEVTSFERERGHWIARTGAGAAFRARMLVVATGIVSNPHIPGIPNRAAFRGRAFHSVEYRQPNGFGGRRVLIVGAGNSAGEISVELARAGAEVTVAVRSGARVVPRDLAGIPIQYFGVALAVLPLGAQRWIAASLDRLSSLARGPAVLPPPQPTVCVDVPLIGFHLADALRAGTIRLKGGLAGFTTTGVRFTDGSEQPFDDVILATGYGAAVGMLRELIRLDECGFARRRDRVVSLDQPDLYFVGHNYDIRGGLFNIARDARLAARHLSAALCDRSRTSIETPPLPSER